MKPAGSIQIGRDRFQPMLTLRRDGSFAYASLTARAVFCRMDSGAGDGDVDVQAPGGVSVVDPAACESRRPSTAGLCFQPGAGILPGSRRRAQAALATLLRRQQLYDASIVALRRRGRPIGGTNSVL